METPSFEREDSLKENFVVEMSVAEYVVQCLVDCGVKHVFGGHGGAVVPLIDAVCANPGIEWVLMRNELNASITAAAYAKMRGLDGLGCCVGTSGPGSSHLTTGIIEAVQDRLPLLCITGLKKASSLGYSDFQDINQSEIFRAAGCTMSFTIAHKDQIIPLIRDCVATALTQSTAVHLAIPVDVQQAIIRAPSKKLCSSGAGQRVHNHLPCEEELVGLAQRFIEFMKNPDHEFVIAVGRRGIQASAQVIALAELLKAPVVTILDAKGAVPENHPACAGCIGIFGNPGLEIPTKLMERCGTVVSVGVDNHMTLLVGTDGLQIRRHVEFDVDSSLIETRFNAEATCVGPIRETLTRVVELIASKAAGIRREWPAELAEHKLATPGSYEVSASEVSAGFCHPGAVLMRLSTLLPARSVVCLDVGDVTLWAALALCLDKPEQRVLASLRLGTMGYSICGALAAGTLRPGASVVAIAGDGGVQMSINELATLKQHKIRCLLIVFRNGILGRVANEDWGNGDVPKGCDLDNPDFVALAKAYGGRGHLLTDSSDVAAIDAALKDGLSAPEGGLCLVEVMQDPRIKAGMFKSKLRRIQKVASETTMDK